MIEENGFSESQAEILKAMKKKKVSEYESNFSSSLKRGLMAEHEDGESVSDKIVSRILAKMESDPTLADAERIARITGEAKDNLNVNVKLDLEGTLKKITDEQSF